MGAPVTLHAPLRRRGPRHARGQRAAPVNLTSSIRSEHHVREIVRGDRQKNWSTALSLVSQQVFQQWGVSLTPADAASPDDLQQQIRRGFDACREAVEAELAFERRLTAAQAGLASPAVSGRPTGGRRPLRCIPRPCDRATAPARPLPRAGGAVRRTRTRRADAGRGQRANRCVAVSRHRRFERSVRRAGPPRTSSRRTGRRPAGRRFRQGAEKGRIVKDQARPRWVREAASWLMSTTSNGAPSDRDRRDHPAAAAVGTTAGGGRVGINRPILRWQFARRPLPPATRSSILGPLAVQLGVTLDVASKAQLGVDHRS